MMNVLALGLLFTSLVTAGFFSPAPENKNPKENVVLKDGQRVVVEFESNDGNTKVSISPQDYEKGFVDDVDDKLSETKEKLKTEYAPDTEEIRRGFNPRELVCDAYGRCKHKIAASLGKVKEAVEDKAHEAADKVHEVEKEVGGAFGKVKDKAWVSKENVKDSAREAKDKVSEKASEVKEGASDQADKAKRHAEEMVENASDRVKQGAHKVEEEGKRGVVGILRRARAFVFYVLALVLPPVSVNSVSGVLHLLGFAGAYGMCIWVTFASSYVLATALPRHQFALAQSKIYPVYFRAMAYCVGMALLGHLLSQRRRLSSSSVGMFQASNLVAPLLMVLVNLLYLEPRATKVMFERMKKEKEEGRGEKSHETEPETVTRGIGSADGTRGSVEDKIAETEAVKAEILRMSETLRRLNSYSSFLNVLTLMFLTCHLVYLGQRLHIAC